MGELQGLINGFDFAQSHRQLALAAASAALGCTLLWQTAGRMRHWLEYLRTATPQAAKGVALAVARAKAISPMPGDLTRGFTPDDRAFLPAALELLETPPSPVRIAGIWLICALFAATLIWSYFGKLDIHAVAQGRIQPSGRSKVIQPLEAGKVVAILVENGSKVNAGDVLLELDPTETGADREQQLGELQSLRAEIARRRATIEAAAAEGTTFKPRKIRFDDGVNADVRLREENVHASDLGQLRSSRASLEAQYAEHVATRNKLTASIKAREKVLALAKERVDMRTQLNEQGSLSRALVIEVLAQYETQVTQQIGEQGQLAETEAQLLTTGRKIEEGISQFINDQTTKLAEAERKADRTAQDSIKANAKSARSTLKAPISGTVQQLAVSTVGQVVGSGQSLMTVVPSEGPIEIEAMIQNQDVGFVEPGQEAVIKVEAFPFTRYGSISGTVQRVSRDAVEEREAQAMADPMTAARPGGAQTGAGQKGPSLVFPATIKLERNTINVDGKIIPLGAGMAVTVEILTGQRRAIDYVLSPLREIASSSGRER